MTTHSMENIEQWNKIDRNRTMLRVFQYCVVFILMIMYQINNTIYLHNIKSFLMASPSNKLLLFQSLMFLLIITGSIFMKL